MTTSESMTHSTDRDTLPAVQCAPWCIDGKGHRDALHPRDQFCISEDVRVTLVREGITGGRLVLDDVQAYLMLDRFEAEPHVRTTHNERPDVSMTLDEAEQYFQGGLALVHMRA